MKGWQRQIEEPNFKAANDLADSRDISQAAEGDGQRTQDKKSPRTPSQLSVRKLEHLYTKPHTSLHMKTRKHSQNSTMQLISSLNQPCVSVCGEGTGVSASSLLLTNKQTDRKVSALKNITTLAEVNIERNVYQSSEDKHRLPIATSLVTVLTRVAIKRCMHVCVLGVVCLTSPPPPHLHPFQ